ncbi:MAG: hypothetical protein ACI8U4_000834 [Natronomonas sp.]|jgi:hypothetical protein
MNTLAKRIHNLTPKDVELTFEDDTTVRLDMASAEFFQEEFQGEGTDPEGTTYRLVSDGDADPLVAGKETDDGWVSVGEVVDVAAAEE